MPDHVNGCVTRAVATGGTVELGLAPSFATGALAQSASDALGLAAHQAVTVQTADAVAQQATVLGGIATLFAIDTATLAASTRKLLND